MLNSCTILNIGTLVTALKGMEKKKKKKMENNVDVTWSPCLTPFFTWIGPESKQATLTDITISS